MSRRNISWRSGETFLGAFVGILASSQRPPVTRHVQKYKTAWIQQQRPPEPSHECDLVSRKRGFDHYHDDDTSHRPILAQGQWRLTTLEPPPPAAVE